MQTVARSIRGVTYAGFVIWREIKNPDDNKILDRRHSHSSSASQTSPRRTFLWYTVKERPPKVRLSLFVPARPLCDIRLPVCRMCAQMHFLCADGPSLCARRPSASPLGCLGRGPEPPRGARARSQCFQHSTSVTAAWEEHRVYAVRDIGLLRVAVEGREPSDRPPAAVVPCQQFELWKGRNRGRRRLVSPRAGSRIV